MVGKVDSRVVVVVVAAVESIGQRVGDTGDIRGDSYSSSFDDGCKENNDLGFRIVAGQWRPVDDEGLGNDAAGSTGG